MPIFDTPLNLHAVNDGPSTSGTHMKTRSATLVSPTGEAPPSSQPQPADLALPHLSQPLRLALHALLLIMASGFFALHYLHLAADFPNFSPWMDWSKYTDEGWYGDAAIRHYLLGHWYVAGDFNPAAALPVWPLLEGILFHFTGVSLVAERALTVSVFGGILIASWLLLSRSSRPAPRASLSASLAVLLLAANPFCFVFSRLGILEPLLILLMLGCLLAAQGARPLASRGFFTWRTELAAILRLNLAPVIAIGILLPLLILTKTTGLFLVPAIALMLFAALGYRIRPFLQVGLPAAALASTLWLAYFLLYVEPHYLADFHYLFSANAYTRITRKNFFSVIAHTFHAGVWMGGFLYTAAIAAFATVLFNVRRLRSYPVIPVLIVWALSYLVFLAYHNNLQPRYYLVIAVPLTLLVPVVFRDLVHPRFRLAFPAAMGVLAAALCFALILILDGAQTIAIATHPQYTFVDAAQRIKHFIAADHERDPAHSMLVLSISGSDLSLMTGLHSICDDFGTAELADRAQRYNPGWYLSWNLIEDDKMDALAPLFHVERVATFPAMDDQDRNLLVLYRLEPEDTGAKRQTHVRNRHTRTKLGQQPSQVQLQH